MGGSAVHREEQLAAYYAFLQVLAEATTWQEASRRLLQLIGEFFGWQVASLWTVSQDGERLVWQDGWTARGLDMRVFHEMNGRVEFTRGHGLLGRVWEDADIEWLPDVAEDPGFLRAEAAALSGLRSAVALPLVGTDGVIGVVEFLAAEVRETNEDFVEFLRTVGRQVGQYVERQSAEARVRASDAVTRGIIEAALDCVITMDTTGCVVDFNPAAEATFGYSRDEARGRELAELIVPPNLREAHRSALRRVIETGQAQLLDRRLELTGMRADGSEFPVELTITRISTDAGTMFAGFIRDVSDRYRNAAELERLLERERAARLRAEAAERRSRQVAQTLRQTVLPPSLPSIEGIELSGAYRAGGEGVDVGGDFYDVFLMSGGRWGCAIGDVCGKGPEAAAVTALARYTIRTAASRELHAAAVLRALNDGMLGDGVSAEFVTAAYVALEPWPGGAKLCVSLGGHPPPLILRASGEVERIGRRGTLLGAVPEPQLHEVSGELGPGDALVLYTDGLIEAPAGDNRLGEDGLCELLAGLRGEGASVLAQRLLQAASDETQRSRDDVALLVVRVPVI